MVAETTIAEKLHTIEDLEALPDDGRVYELIDGVLVRREPVGATHGAVQWMIGGWIWQFLRANPIGVAFGSDTIYEFQRNPDRGLKPDLTFVRTERLPAREDFDKPLDIVPDLVVEVVSPNDRAYAIEEKIDTYRRAGVPLIWILWPRRRSIWVYEGNQPLRVLGEDDELDGDDVLPGFRVAVADLFRVGRQPRE
jgi:Uma2 family endonuclease